DISTRISALNSVVTALTKAGHFGEARDLAASIADGELRAQALGVVVAGLTEVRRFGEARDLAASIEDTTTRVYALSGIAVALFAQAPHEAQAVLNDAIAMAWTVGNTDTRLQLLSYAAEILARV